MGEKQKAHSFINDFFSREKMNQISQNMASKDKKEILRYIVENKAWVDTTIRERKKDQSEVINNKQQIVKYMIDRLNELGRDGKSFKSWHRETISGLDSYGMKLGLAQKFINMSIKYIYFLELGFGCEVFEDKSISEYQDEFDVPIDSYILKWVLFNSLFEEEINKNANELSVWTEIVDEEVYRLLQDRAKSLLEERFPKVPILIAESEVWNRVKTIKDIV